MSQSKILASIFTVLLVSSGWHLDLGTSKKARNDSREMTDFRTTVKCFRTLRKCILFRITWPEHLIVECSHCEPFLNEIRHGGTRNRKWDWVFLNELGYGVSRDRMRGWTVSFAHSNLAFDLITYHDPLIRNGPRSMLRPILISISWADVPSVRNNLKNGPWSIIIHLLFVPMLLLPVCCQSNYPPFLPVVVVLSKTEK